ncbi:MAG: hypothetical protein JWN40_5415 [Phycisphaerales bacterium]|nr:hypothetical protein [Phycisphaerales bacterium]
MANMFKRAALALGRFTGLKRTPYFDPQIDLIGPTPEQPIILFGDSSDAGQSAIDPALDARGNPWNDVLSTNDALARQDTDAAIEAAIATGQFEVSDAELDVESIKPIDSPLIAAAFEPVMSAEAIDDEEPAKIPVELAAEEPVVIQAVVEEASPIIEMKPDPLKTPISTPEPSVTFTQLYELISGEVNKRTDSAVTVYERLLNATREELEATRKNNRIAWSVGGVMTAVAAFGAVWAAGEVSANRVEVGSLRQQVISAQQVSLERDQLRTDLVKTREASAKIEIDMLKARLDQALTVTAERDRFKDELQMIRQAKLDAEFDLRIARAAAATQPVSQKPAATDKPAAREAVAGAGSERPDVWSTLLDGKDGH